MRRHRRDAAEALAQDGPLNPHPEAIRDTLFTGNPFFDAKDIVQVRYEMVRVFMAEELLKGPSRNGDAIARADPETGPQDRGVAALHAGARVARDAAAAMEHLDGRP